MLTLIIMVAFSILATIIGFVFMSRMLNAFEEALDFYFTTLMSQMSNGLKKVTEMEDDLSIAISRLPVSKSRKVQKEIEESETKESNEIVGE